jgi:drug/metabolite transporter (DMT)-like permease
MSLTPGRLRPHHVGFVLLLVTAVGWGLNWPAMKLLLREWPPLFSRGVAGTTAALGFALVARMRGQSLAVPRALFGRLAAAAATNVFAWMGFSTLSMLWLKAGEGALLVYTMPIWATLLAWPLLGDRPTSRGLAALALGVAGVGVLLGGQDMAVGAEKLPGALLALAAAFLFALGTVATRTPLALPPLVAVAWQVGLGCLPMVGLGLAFEAPDLGALSPRGWTLMAYMTAVPMGACYLSWFAALRRLPPAQASMATLLTPLVGVVAAALSLGEPLGLREASALALTLGGVALAMRRG